MLLENEVCKTITQEKFPNENIHRNKIEYEIFNCNY